MAPTNPTEIVTHARLSSVTVPGLDRPAALITLDNGFDHTIPNTFGPGGLASLSEAIDAALAAQPSFIAVTGKPHIFLAGADLGSFATMMTSRDQVLEIGRMGQTAFAKLRESSVPTFAFVNGVAVSGGLEVAMHCHYRTLSSDITTLGMFEVGLSLVPCWGGSQLLPNLIGITPALQVIVQNPLMQNTLLNGRQAAEFGIGDILLEPEDFLQRSLEWAAGVVNGTITVRRPEIDRSATWDAVLGSAKVELDKKLHGAMPSVDKAMKLLALAKDGVTQANLDAEIEALADLAFTPELASSLYAVDLVRRQAKQPTGAPDPALARKVTKVGIIGTDPMASQLALLFTRRLKVPVVLTDPDSERLDKSVGEVHSEIDKQVANGTMSTGSAAELRSLVSGSVDRSAFSDADLVIETVFDDLSVKKQVWAEIEKIVTPECVLVTTTSSLSVTQMAADLEHPERVVGLHFFDPVTMTPLLEIVRAEHTNDATLATAFAVGTQLEKSCVLVKDAPAFVVNRVLARLVGEIFRAVDAGTAPEVANRALDPLGLPMRPFTLLDLIGPAVAAHVGGVLHEQFPDRFGVSDNLSVIASSGKPLLIDDELNPEVVALLTVGNQPLTEEQVRTDVLEALAQEIRLMLDEGVVAEAADIDLCMILGAGWPFHLGGITPYLDHSGVAERVTTRRFGS
ncbi:3-hydroxyacyl-CoA dehydrogenase NAD-binding domain-containing protein [Actinoplanes subtropicus]|uniref:3-hydroxyacyl-CoA dehydrogenase NAD-binding domain-containing protein n=1 Tax=Actinoplanes subtropicus TaxID=543632 RepID=UPI0004C3E7FB|nr:3-hydroxyacyl-CoA dehydrogenase NAD-binding domain-containing protein [Actinoplanes subtropicus]